VGAHVVQQKKNYGKCLGNKVHDRAAGCGLRAAGTIGEGARFPQLPSSAQTLPKEESDDSLCGLCVAFAL
jgi:hypothetical protein